MVAQQFEVAAQITGHGLMPIIEPEVSIKSPDKAGAETILREELTKKLDALPGGQVMLKLTIPEIPDFYASLIAHPARGQGRRIVPAAIRGTTPASALPPITA